ncbi:hypothetical protein WAI453_012321 [Rhynchosporium graminicola]
MSGPGRPPSISLEAAAAPSSEASEASEAREARPGLKSLAGSFLISFLIYLPTLQYLLSKKRKDAQGILRDRQENGRCPPLHTETVSLLSSLNWIAFSAIGLAYSTSPSAKPQINSGTVRELMRISGNAGISKIRKLWRISTVCRLQHEQQHG